MNTPLPVRSQYALLRACLKNWRRCIENPVCCSRLCRLSRFVTQENVREVLRWLISTDGDWKTVRNELRSRAYAPKLFAWADRKAGAL